MHLCVVSRSLAQSSLAPEHAEVTEKVLLLAAGPRPKAGGFSSPGTAVNAYTAQLLWVSIWRADLGCSGLRRGFCSLKLAPSRG